ncbi:rhodanese [Phragmitibacter flavus]|uniref:Rhodanese n=1 Tax=Phragmitibacter flavus TaxID=2576071 RepID=A0A5R8KCB6_9BACT|nr:rhodanese-like domain-containing protein [Phragmitibacter flavus]TLD69575.1 rhodanese [Phragmitibacter flavus]
MKTTEVTAEELSRWIGEGNPNFRLVDVREQDEYEICRLPGSELIPLSNFADLAPGKLGEKSETIVVYCHHGMRSQRAANWLRQQGYEDVINLTGGIDAWSETVDASVPRY